MALTLKEQADEVAVADTARFEAKEAEMKKAHQEVLMHAYPATLVVCLVALFLRWCRHGCRRGCARKRCCNTRVDEGLACLRLERRVCGTIVSIGWWR